MTKIVIAKTHNKPAEEVEKLVDALQIELANKYGLKSQRNGDLVDFTGAGLKGTLSMDPNEVKIDLKLGMMMTMLAGKIESALKEKLNIYLDE